jgi:Fe-S-cluster containining protein
LARRALPPTELYSCRRCPAYCCSYPRIVTGVEDIARLAGRFGVSPEVARLRYTKRGEEPGERVLRHKLDEHFGTICRFLDGEGRHCTVYEARPQICREFPGGRRCGYYDFLSFERRAQEDPDYVSTTNNL